MSHQVPSSFYQALEKAQPYLLKFPIGADGTGPIWSVTGSLLESDNEEIESEPIESVPLGNNLFRLSELCNGPFSCLQLRWVDEFFAETNGRNELTFRGLKMPLSYQHYFLITAGGFSNDDPLSDVIHRFSGGWEVVAVGILTITVPMLQAKPFELEAASLGWNLQTARLR